MIIEKQGKLGEEQLAALRQKGAVARYDCDPLVEVFNVTEGVYSILSKSPGLGGDAWIHLVIGEERALLIDTGFGIGNLKALVETLTDKPYEVFNTHFHGDHVLGNVQFPRVYIHAYDEAPLRAAMTPEGSAEFVPKTGGYYTEADIMPFHPYEVISVEAGYTFSLGGGETLEVVHLPGHSAGCAGLLDNKKRILFSGDAVLATPTFIFGNLPEDPLAPYMTITGYRNGLQEFTKRMDEFDSLYPGHALLGVPKEVITDTIKTCDAIIAQPDVYDDILHFGERSGFIRQVGWGSIAFSKERI
jgi:glyoxylase-like metal-dependent hydrolase (beta-lactamase superfamily II)